MEKEQFCNEWWNTLSECRKFDILYHVKTITYNRLLDIIENNVTVICSNLILNEVLLSIWNELSTEQKHKLMLSNYGENSWRHESIEE